MAMEDVGEKTRFRRDFMPRCGAKNLVGKPCLKPAGWGTKHPGVGPCKFHEGKVLAGESRYPPLIYLLDPQLRALVMRMLQNDEELMNLRYELAVLRSRFFEMALEGENRDLTTLAKSIGELATRLQDLETSKHMYIHVGVVGLVLQAVGQVAAQYVPDNKREAFAADLREAVRKLLPASTTRAIAASSLAEPISSGM